MWQVESQTSMIDRERHNEKRKSVYFCAFVHACEVEREKELHRELYFEYFLWFTSSNRVRASYDCLQQLRVQQQKQQQQPSQTTITTLSQIFSELQFLRIYRA